VALLYLFRRTFSRRCFQVLRLFTTFLGITHNKLLKSVDIFSYLTKIFTKNKPYFFILESTPYRSLDVWTSVAKSPPLTLPHLKSYRPTVIHKSESAIAQIRGSNFEFSGFPIAVLPLRLLARPYRPRESRDAV
jgi:hypothetical protein